MATKNKEQLRAHLDRIERLSPEKLSQVSLDTALRQSVFFSAELKNIQTCVDNLLSIATPTEQQLDEHERELEKFQLSAAFLSSLDDTLRGSTYLSAELENMSLKSHSSAALDREKQTD
ncbi:hypothetical protein G7Y79_00032g067220 [Physcia stellaris]|nr:hypothetical protein G7Y79_00032g067220 [Physcia stellaris]